jgi:hypothetical protein
MYNKFMTKEQTPLEKALSSKTIGEVELKIISDNISQVPAKELKRLGLVTPTGPVDVSKLAK